MGNVNICRKVVHMQNNDNYIIDLKKESGTTHLKFTSVAILVSEDEVKLK